MADPGYTPNYGAGGRGDASPAYRSYYDYMSSTFVDHFNGLPARLQGAGGLPRPLDSEEYYDDYDSNQSSTCAQLAVDFYNQQQGNSPITLHRAKDSHKFFSEGTAYFHVNFKAAFDGGSGPHYAFFAEVEGPDGVPESATMVVQFHNKEEGRTRDNCLYCTGLSHPEQGGFVGHCRLPHHQDPQQQGDGGEEKEEDNGGGGGDNGDETMVVLDDDEDGGGGGDQEDDVGGGINGDKEIDGSSDSDDDNEEDSSSSDDDEDDKEESDGEGGD